MTDRPSTGSLAPALRDRVLERLGLEDGLAADLEGLGRLYRAWCRHVPFDNVRKMIALRAGDGRSLPGGRAEDLLEGWLEHGAGGTCWPTSNALYQLARSLGFEARRIVGQMGDRGAVNHGSVRVELEGRSWLVDSSLLHEVPLPLDGEGFVGADPVVPVEVEQVAEGRHLLWVILPPWDGYLPCRLLPEEASHQAYLAGYEATRQRSIFNQRLCARRNRAGEQLVLVGSTRFSKTAAGLTSRELSRDELLQALRQEIGLGEQLLEAWVRAGGLEASFEPPSGPPPPPVVGLPPSLRGG